MSTTGFAALTVRLWLMHAGIGLILASPIVFFGRRRVMWEWWELLAVVIPFVFWYSLMCSGWSAGKSLANLGECFYISLAIPIVASIRVWLGNKERQRGCAAVLIGLLCVVAVGVFFLTPPLEE